jgi:hypothetical protein
MELSVDTVTALHGKTAPKADSQVDIIRDVMRGYAMLLGLREAEASALASAIASGPERPSDEREALARVERAVLDPADRDGSDRMLLATWLAAQDSDRDLSRLPKGSPVATGLSMPPQNLSPIALQDVAQLFGFAARPTLQARLETRRSRVLGGDV